MFTPMLSIMNVFECAFVSLDKLTFSSKSSVIFKGFAKKSKAYRVNVLACDYTI